LDRAFLPGDAAIMVPRTSDGRVLFAIPWHDHVLIGTTDTPITKVDLEPVALGHEIDFLLETAAQYLHRAPTRGDVRSVFAGIRPLVKSGEASSTAALSRDHTIHVSQSGLLTIAGGKWTTYRKMAEDCVDHAATIARLDERPCVTKTLHIHGHEPQAEQFGELSTYGADAPAICELMKAQPGLNIRLHEALPIVAAQVIWAVRHEMARTVDDILSRRTRALFLDAQAAIDMAPKVAALMAAELGRGASWITAQVEQFKAIARNYVLATAE
jgi:glycerol-3-phosphate dehydrogenase